MKFIQPTKVTCKVCGNQDWWKFALREGIHVCLCCDGKKKYDLEKKRKKDVSSSTSSRKTKN